MIDVAARALGVPDAAPEGPGGPALARKHYWCAACAIIIECLTIDRPPTCDCGALMDRFNCRNDPTRAPAINWKP